MTFLHLTKMQVMFLLITYGGRWYYKGDEEPDGLDWNIPPSGSDKRNAYLDGNTPYCDYRKSPNLWINDPIGSLVSAVKRMPSICALEVKTNNPGENEYVIGIEHVNPGYRAQGTMRKPKDMDDMWLEPDLFPRYDEAEGSEAETEPHSVYLDRTRMRIMATMTMILNKPI
ncbi:hypothetical protein BDW69DRAFT_186160 [Aspergillus filifer]